LKVSQICEAINHFGLETEANKIMAIVPAVIPAGAELQAILDEPAAAPAVAGQAFEASGVLSIVEPFLSSGLVRQMETALAPIVAAANKPAVVKTVEIERIVEREALPPLKAGEVRRATRVSMSTMQKVFSVGGQRGKLPVQLWDDPLAETPDVGFVLDSGTMFLMATCLERSEPAWLAGDMSTGKTTLARFYCAKTGRHFVRIGFHAQIELVDLLGQKEPEPAGDGSTRMVWKDAVFTQAIRRPGTVILLDEITGARPGVQMAFQTIVDERRVTLPTGEVVKFADGVAIVFADNTAGYGDESGIYAGTHQANAALVDRAARVITMDFLPVFLEAEALERRTGAPAAACARLAQWAKDARSAQAKAGGNVRPVSLRRLIAFVQATYRDLIPVDDAYNVVFATRLPYTDREVLRQHWRVNFQEKAYKAELEGKVVIAPDNETAEAASVATDPRQDAARAMFDAV
jgi:MoxR-like ATPase